MPRGNAYDAIINKLGVKNYMKSMIYTIERNARGYMP